MKKLFLLLAIISISFSCVSQKDNQEFSIKEVILNAHTRGAMENISFLENTITLKNHNTNKTNTISKEQKNKLINLAKSLDLPSISELIAPSDKRHSDGTLHASLTIKTSNTSYKSSDFDYDNPPKELKEIINFLKELSK